MSSNVQTMIVYLLNVYTVICVGITLTFLLLKDSLETYFKRKHLGQFNEIADKVGEGKQKTLIFQDCLPYWEGQSCSLSSWITTL